MKSITLGVYTDGLKPANDGQYVIHGIKESDFTEFKQEYKENLGEILHKAQNFQSTNNYDNSDLQSLDKIFRNVANYLETFINFIDKVIEGDYDKNLYSELKNRALTLKNSSKKFPNYIGQFTNSLVDSTMNIHLSANSVKNFALNYVDKNVQAHKVVDINEAKAAWNNFDTQKFDTLKIELLKEINAESKRALQTIKHALNKFDETNEVYVGPQPAPQNLNKTTRPTPSTDYGIHQQEIFQQRIPEQGIVISPELEEQHDPEDTLVDTNLENIEQMYTQSVLSGQLLVDNLRAHGLPLGDNFNLEKYMGIAIHELSSLLTEGKSSECINTYMLSGLTNIVFKEILGFGVYVKFDPNNRQWTLSTYDSSTKKRVPLLMFGRENDKFIYQFNAKLNENDSRVSLIKQRLIQTRALNKFFSPQVKDVILDYIQDLKEQAPTRATSKIN